MGRAGLPAWAPVRAGAAAGCGLREWESSGAAWSLRGPLGQYLLYLSTSVSRVAAHTHFLGWTVLARWPWAAALGGGGRPGPSRSSKFPPSSARGCSPKNNIGPFSTLIFSTLLIPSSLVRKSLAQRPLTRLQVADSRPSSPPYKFAFADAQSAAGAAAMKEYLDSDRVNFLVWRSVVSPSPNLGQAPLRRGASRMLTRRPAADTYSKEVCARPFGFAVSRSSAKPVLPSDTDRPSPFRRLSGDGRQIPKGVAHPSTTSPAFRIRAPRQEPCAGNRSQPRACLSRSRARVCAIPGMSYRSPYP